MKRHPSLRWYMAVSPSSSSVDVASAQPTRSDTQLSIAVSTAERQELDQLRERVEAEVKPKLVAP